MIASTHLAAGVFSGLFIQRYLPENSGVIEKIGAGFCAGFVSHLILDAIPHKDYDVSGYVLGGVLSVEILAVLCLVFYPARSAIMNWIILFGMAGAAFPDLFSLGYQYGFKWRWLYDVGQFFHVFHGKSDAVYKMNILSQIFLIILFLLGSWRK